MKYLLALIFSTSLYAQTAKIGMIAKTVASNATPERLSSTNLLVRCAHIQAVSTNTGLAFAGTSVSNAVSGQGWTLARGSLSVPATDLSLCPVDLRGPKINLYDIFIGVAVNGEKVVAYYIE